MLSNNQNQSLLFKGIYEFEDPSGSLIAANLPANGTANLCDRTAVVVKPNQSVLFIYKGKFADLIPSGTYEISMENVPLLTRLASWKFGFESPLKCEFIFLQNRFLLQDVGNRESCAR